MSVTSSKKRTILQVLFISKVFMTVLPSFTIKQYFSRLHNMSWDAISKTVAYERKMKFLCPLTLIIDGYWITRVWRQRKLQIKLGKNHFDLNFILTCNIRQSRESCGRFFKTSWSFLRLNCLRWKWKTWAVVDLYLYWCETASIPDRTFLRGVSPPPLPWYLRVQISWANFLWFFELPL